MNVQFQRPVLVEGERFKAGAIVPADSIPTGCLESMLSVGWVVEVAETSEEEPQPESESVEDEAEAPEAEAPDPKPKPKRNTKAARRGE